MNISIDELEAQLTDLTKQLAISHLRNFNPRIKDIRMLELRQKVLSVAESALIKTVLQATHNNKAKTSKLMGISKNTLLAKIKDYRINP